MKDKLMKGIEFIKNIISTRKQLIIKIMAPLIIIIAILVISSCFKEAEYGNSTANAYNLGLAVQDGKWIYYVETDAGEPVGICRVKNNGKKEEKVAEGQMCYLNIIDNYIYCLEYDEDNYRNNLIKIKTNGKNKQILARDIDDEQIIATNKWIYYFKSDSLYRAKLDGTSREKISDRDIEYYHIDDHWIYYIYSNEGSQYIAKMKLDGDDAQRIAKAEETTKYQTIYVKGSKIYYVISKANENYDYTYYLCRMNKKGEKIKQICKLDANVQDISMQEEIIYYTVTKDYDEYEIKSIKYNGTNKKTLKKSEDVSNINIVGNWILFLGLDDDYEDTIKMISLDGKKEENL